jgi:hypothetical protein
LTEQPYFDQSGEPSDAPPRFVRLDAEQQIARNLSGEPTFTVGCQTRLMHAGGCVAIPPDVEHGVAGPEGCRAPESCGC